MVAHRSHAGGFIIAFIARVLYLGALATIVPAAILMLASPLEAVPIFFEYVPFYALAIVLLSVIMLYFHEKSIGHVFLSLGWMTIIPGIGGAVFLYFGRETVLSWLTIFFGIIPVLAPVLAVLESIYPNLWLLVIAYIVLGIILLHIAGKLEREYALSMQVKKLFGRRARVIRSH